MILVWGVFCGRHRFSSNPVTKRQSQSKKAQNSSMETVFLKTSSKLKSTRRKILKYFLPAFLVFPFSFEIPQFAANMNPQSLIRAIVSTPKQIFQDQDGYLDLSYITPRLIVAAGPTDNLVSSLFRSPLHRLVAHLNRNYSDGETKFWHVWNLRGEERGYQLDEDDVENWSFRPFPDHQPPSMLLLEKVAIEISTFLSSNPRNVALIHCKEGKGRSGTICSAYLMFEAKRRGGFMLAADAINFFTRNRMRRFFGAGVSTMCQIRYLRYWESLLQNSDAFFLNFEAFHSVSSFPFDVKTSKITRLRIFRPTPFLLFHKVTLLTYILDDEGVNMAEIAERKMTISNLVNLAGALDINLDLNITQSLKEIKLVFDGPISLAYTWFNLFFESFKDHTPLLSELDTANFKLNLAWADFDGFVGIQGGTLGKLFDQVEVHWVLGPIIK